MGCHPDYVSALYLDAPLLNMLSYPMGYGVGTQHLYVFDEEIAPAYGFTLSDLINYRDMPYDRIHTLVPGMLILRHIAARLDAEELVVSKYGVREGYLCQKLLTSNTITPRTES